MVIFHSYVSHYQRVVPQNFLTAVSLQTAGNLLLSEFSIKGAMAWSSIYTDENMRVLRRGPQGPQNSFQMDVLAVFARTSLTMYEYDEYDAYIGETISDPSIAKIMQLKPTEKRRKRARKCFLFLFLCHLK